MIDRLEQVAIAAGRGEARRLRADAPARSRSLRDRRGGAGVAGDRMSRSTSCMCRSRAGLAALEAARRRGVPLWAETCPQYILLDEQCVRRHGPLAVIAPPLREPADQSALAARADDRRRQFDRQRSRELQSRRKGRGEDNIFAAPFGMPGAPTLWPSLFTWAIDARRAAAGPGAGDVGNARAAVWPRASQGHAAAGRRRRHHPRRSGARANRRRWRPVGRTLCPSPLAGCPSPDGRRSRSRAARSSGAMASVTAADGRGATDHATERKAADADFVKAGKQGKSDVATITQTLADFADATPAAPTKLRGAWRSTHSTPWR